MSYSFLKPVRIGNMVLKNRVIVPAMARYLCKDGYVTDAYVEYLRAIAEGGVAMVTVGIMPIDLNWPSTMPTQPCLGDDKYIPGLTRAVAAIHAGGAKASLQPWMPGRAPYTYANAVERAQDIAIVNRLTVDEIHNIQKKYAAAALRCAMAGADVVEWHNAHNYLGEQFFSPYFNHRTDEYGQQSVENSMRFAREALTLTRRTLDAAGYSHVELIAKLNGSQRAGEGRHRTHHRQRRRRSDPSGGHERRRPPSRGLEGQIRRDRQECGVHPRCRERQPQAPVLCGCDHPRGQVRSGRARPHLDLRPALGQQVQGRP